MKEIVQVMRCLRKIVFISIIAGLMLLLAITAVASETFQTTDTVRLRSGPSTEGEILKVINPGTNVDVLEHDPAGWSMVKFNGSTGYVRSDFLKFPTGGKPAMFRTTDTVNFRTSPSNDDVSNKIRTLDHGASVDVMEHDPAGWSKVSANGSVGYIRSDFLTRDIINLSPAPAAPSAPSILWTADGVRLRAGPSTDSEILSVLSAGTAVSVNEQGSNGWSRVSVNGTVGFIRSDLLRGSPTGGTVEYLEWSAAKSVVTIGVPIRVLDVRTGLSFTIKCFSKSGHADVEPLTAADTETILRTRGGTWAWDPRPVLVTIGGRTIAASMNGKPHAGSTISGNNMNGHLCLHFGNTVTTSKTYQADLRNAVLEAYGARQMAT